MGKERGGRLGEAGIFRFFAMVLREGEDGCVSRSALLTSCCELLVSKEYECRILLAFLIIWCFRIEG